MPRKGRKRQTRNASHGDSTLASGDPASTTDPRSVAAQASTALAPVVAGQPEGVAHRTTASFRPINTSHQLQGSEIEAVSAPVPSSSARMKDQPVASATGSAKASAPTTLTKTKPKRRLDPTKLAEQVIELRLDEWRARAKAIRRHRVDEPETTHFLPPSPQFFQDLTLFDEFSTTWLITTCRKAPIWSTDPGAAEKLRQRSEELEALIQNPGNKKEVGLAGTIFLTEAKMYCEEELKALEALTKIERNIAPDALVPISASDIVDMIGRSRLLRRVTGLPGYFRVNLLDLDHKGWASINAHFVPPWVTMAELLTKFDALKPAHRPLDEDLLHVARHMTSAGQESWKSEATRNKADNLMSELNHPRYILDAADSKRRVWSYKLFIGEEPKFTAGGLGSKRGWIEIRDEASFHKMMDGARAGKFPAVVRTWKVHLSMLWSQIEAMAKSDEQEFTSEQLEMLDSFLFSDGGPPEGSTNS